jgi:hypothetical protein
LFDRDGLIAWTARPGGSSDIYLALFNARDRQPLDAARARFRAELRGAASIARIPIDIPITAGSRLVLVADDGQGRNGDHHAVVWADLRLAGPAGELHLADLDWVSATSRWGSVMRNAGPGGRSLMLAGEDVERGFGVHVKSVIEFLVPQGYARLVGAVGFEGPKPPAKDTDRARCLVFVEPPEPSAPSAGLTLSVTAEDLGVEGSLHVKDLWSGEDLGASDRVLEATVPWHGARLLRVSTARQQ